MRNVKTEVLQVLPSYLNRFHQQPDLQALVQQLRNDDGDIFSRGNMQGHITTSALVVDEKHQEALLIHHNIYGRWLPPGGHYEDGEPVVLSPTGLESWLWPSAMREVAEETGLERPDRHNWSVGLCLPFDIDTHTISENPKKEEKRHVHHDFLYLAGGSCDAPLKPQLDEVSGAKWVPLDHLTTLDARMQRVYARLVEYGIARP